MFICRISRGDIIGERKKGMRSLEKYSEIDSINESNPQYSVSEKQQVLRHRARCHNPNPTKSLGDPLRP